MTPEQFVRKWGAVQLSERSASHQHFLDLCQLLGEPTPAEADPTGTAFTFEKGGTTATGGHGWADVWKKGAFAWEYKGPGKDLSVAYLQLKKYADMLENPPLLITSDTKRIEIHTNFTNTVKRVFALELQDLLEASKRDLIRSAFNNPERLRPGLTRATVTKEAAANFSVLAHKLQSRGYEPHQVAHFLNRLIFSMFAEDVGLLPNKIFSKLAVASVAHPESFEANARQLFAGMSKGGSVAFETIDWFNGGLFENDETLPLNSDELKLVLQCAELDWSNIEPSIFGTLFERGLDPDKRSQQGTHYTDPDTILKIVKPVVLDPLEREWEEEKTIIARQVDRAKRTISEAAQKRYFTFLNKLAEFRVLDPACGSGNFLYLTLRGLKDLEKRVILEAEALGLPAQFPRVGPEAVLGIEVNPYAAELARVTIWIGEIQWMIENGFGTSKNPILKSLDQIECRDAILNDNGSEPVWPRANAIVGNPPFLGSRKMRPGLGDGYVAALRKAYARTVPTGADLVCFWVAKAWSLVETGSVERAGLVATNSITGGSSRRVIEPIAKADRFTHVWPDEPWVVEGAAVHVSIACFSHGVPSHRYVNGTEVLGIGPDLEPVHEAGSGFDPSRAVALPENDEVSFQGIVPRSNVKKAEALKLNLPEASFVVAGELARQMLTISGNPNARPNSDVVLPYLIADDITGRPMDRFIVDFQTMPESAASAYEAPFAYITPVRAHRAAMSQPEALETWWLHWRSRPDMRGALKGLQRFVVTPRVAKHRIVTWCSPPTLVDNAVVAFARSDDTSFGILQSRIHSVWALRMGTTLEDRPRYTSTTSFQTFPFPDGLTPNIPAERFEHDPRAQRIAAAALRLYTLRDNWLNPDEWVERKPEVVSGYPDRILARSESLGSELKKRTLTKLYNSNPTWLQRAHHELDEAVAASYQWSWPISDEEILDLLFAMNQGRSLRIL